VTEIEKNIQTIQKQIPKHVKIMGVTKGQPLEKILAAQKAGLTCFGENYVQEFLKKWGALKRDASASPQHDWVFIGHLQTNKVKYIIDKVSEIHSVDSLKLFGKIESEAQKVGRNMNVLVQVNVGDEESKFGLHLDVVFGFFKGIDARLQKHVHIKGLMTIPPYFEDPEKSRPYFRKLKSLKEALNKKFTNLNLTELSMGMSHDYKIAIEEGATQIRLGTALFGERSPLSRG